MLQRLSGVYGIHIWNTVIHDVVSVVFYFLLIGLLCLLENLSQRREMDVKLATCSDSTITRMFTN